jgi:hypothetical protein
MEFGMAKFNEMSRMLGMKYVRKVVGNPDNHWLMIKQWNFDWRSEWGSAGVLNDQYRKVVMKLQGDRNENHRMFVNKLKFILHNKKK